MKKINVFLAGVALVAGLGLASCAGKSADSQNNAGAVAETAVAEGSVITLTEDALDTKDAEQLMIIDFNATWCGPCQKFAPIFKAAAEKYAGKVKFISVDIEACPEVAAQYGVSSIPQITYVKPDGTVDSHVGLMSAEEFDAAINAHL
ncbi:MAG: conjugal transfer protein TraF [Muribaculaceae bacterium]|nr:conjugal transfer protein TraF [Muribaculaceae bacterium]